MPPTLRTVPPSDRPARPDPKPVFLSHHRAHRVISTRLRLCAVRHPRAPATFACMPGPHFAKLFGGSSPTTSPVGYGLPRPAHAACTFFLDFQGVLARRLRRTSANSRCSHIWPIFLGSSRTPTPLYRAGFLWGAPLFGHRCKTVLCPVVKPSPNRSWTPGPCPRRSGRHAPRPSRRPRPEPGLWAPPGPPTPIYRHLGRGLRRTSAISRCYPILPKYFGAPRRPPLPSATAYLGHFTLLAHFYRISRGSSPVGYGVPRPIHAARPFFPYFWGPRGPLPPYIGLGFFGGPHFSATDATQCYAAS